MSETDPLAFIRDRQLGEVAADSRPAWLWATDGTAILWANAAGAALFAAPSVGALVERRFAPRHPAAQQVARLAAALPAGGAPRLERLRGFCPGVGRLLTCSCRRLAAPEGTPAILIAATEHAGASLPLAERIRRLLDASRISFAAFSADGTLLHGAADARERLGGALTLSGAADLAATALRDGHAVGATAVGRLSLDRVGSGTNTVLIATFAPEPPAATAPAEPAVSEAADDAASSRAAPTAAPPAPVQTGPHAPAAPAPERRHPLRFVWLIDADGAFSVASEEFIALMGPTVASVLGGPWTQVASELGIDPDLRVTEALASRETFAGIPAAWPVQDADQRLAVELSGLPIFDRDRRFRGYRGFGICRDAARLAALAASRAQRSAAVAEKAGASAPSATPPAGDAGAPPPLIERPLLTVVPQAKNVVPFRPPPPAAAERRQPLNPSERNAFQEIAKALGARIDADAAPDAGVADEPAPSAPGEARGQEAGTDIPAETGEQRAGQGGDEAANANAVPRVWPRPIPSAYAAGTAAPPSGQGNGERAVLDRVPVGVLVCRGNRLLFVNRTLLDWTGYQDRDAITAAGGLDRLLAEPGLSALGDAGSSGERLAITTRQGHALPVEGRLFSIAWHDGSALLIVFVRAEAQEQVRAAEEAVHAAERRIRAAEAALATSDERLKSTELALRASQAATRELESVLETATDGVLVVDRDGMILAGNRSAEALFGYESQEITRRSFVDLFAPESHRTALDYLEGLMRAGVASVLNDGREVIGRVREGGLIPLFMTIGRVTDDKFCVVFRDITQWKRAEEDLINAKREAEKASSAKSDVLAKVSHEIRTPLNAIIGFAEVMLEERFGALGNERYRQYLKDIRTSGEHVISLVNDLLDLSKIEAGKLELTFVSVRLNDVVQQCVAIMQPQANRERIIIRTSLLPSLPPVVADERSIRQIVLNLLSNSIKFTGAGGQVIVSTALTDQGEAVLRVRDTGIGMSEKEIETALEPFRQIASSGRAGVGTGLGLPLTKVLAEANRATFTIKSAIDAGTLVEIAFPATRVLAE